MYQHTSEEIREKKAEEVKQWISNLSIIRFVYIGNRKNFNGSNRCISIQVLKTFNKVAHKYVSKNEL